MKLVNARTLCLDLDMLDENDLHEERIDYPLALNRTRIICPIRRGLRIALLFTKKV